MSDAINNLPDKGKLRMEARLRKYKSEIKLNRLVFLFLILINTVNVMVLSFTGSANGSNYTMDLTYIRVCIGFCILTVIGSLAPIVKALLD